MSVIKTEQVNSTTPNSFDAKVFEVMKQVNRLQNGGGSNVDEETITEINDKIEQVKEQIEGIKEKPIATIEKKLSCTPSAMLSNGLKQWNSVAYGNNKYVAVCSGNQIAYSDDGMKWNPVSTNNRNWSSIVFSDDYYKKFIAVANSSNYYLIGDGVNWEEKQFNSSMKWTSIAYGNGYFMAVASNSTTSAYSTGGTGWSYPSISQLSWTSVCFGDEKFVAVASNSSEGAYYDTEWHSNTMPSADWKSITYGNGKFVAVATGGKFAHSDNGIEWSELLDISETSRSWVSVSFGNDIFVAIAQDSTVCAFSHDGVNWTYQLHLTHVPILNMVVVVMTQQFKHYWIKLMKCRMILNPLIQH